VTKKPSGRDSRAEPGGPNDHLRVDHVYTVRPAKLSAAGTTAPENETEEKRQIEALNDEIRHLRKQLDEVAAFREQIAGLEQRLKETTARATELAQLFTRERNERAALAQRLEEVTASFDRQRAEWKDELIVLQERHALELEVAQHPGLARTDTVDDKKKT